MAIERVKPMLCRSATSAFVAEVDQDPEWGMGEKYDGFRETMYIDERGCIRLFTRSGAEHTANVPHLTRHVIPELANTILDGEGIGPSGRIESTKSVFGSGADTAIAWQKKNGFAKFLVFDVIQLRGCDVTQSTQEIRHAMVMRVVSNLQVAGMSHVFPEILHKTNKAKFYQEIVENGGEGVILKKMNGVYEPGARSKNWLKVKPVKTWDAVIHGFTAGKGKYEGVIGAIIYAFYDKDGNYVVAGRCSGMTDEERHMFMADPDRFKGQVVELAGQEISVKGAIRFPRFKQLRPDKTAQECVLTPDVKVPSL